MNAEFKLDCQERVIPASVERQALLPPILASVSYTSVHQRVLNYSQEDHPVQIPCGPLGPEKSLLNPLSLESSVQIRYLIQSGNSGTSGADNYSTSPYVSPLSL